MRFSETKGRKVVATSTADTVGQVRGFLVDPASRSVVALRLKKSDHGDVLRWTSLTAVGADAITIGAAAAITDLDDDLRALGGKGRRMLRKRVLTTAGFELGSVSDVEFDPGTGSLTAILLGAAGEISADRLVGIGSYAVVVLAQPDDA